MLQLTRKVLNTQSVKKILDQMVTSEKILVVTNTLPLYLLTHEFLSSELISESESQGIAQRVFQLIQRHLMSIKKNAGSLKEPLLYFYQMRNLI